MSEFSAAASVTAANNAASSSAPSSAVADAVQRARQIASKIKPSADPTSPAIALKRPLDKDSSDFASDPLSKKPYGMMNSVPPANPAGEMTVNEVVMVPDKMVGLIIGRGGEQITRLQAESGCKIQMAQDSAGMAERQCTLTGSPVAIQNAKRAIDSIVANEGTGPRPQPGVGGAPQGIGGGPGVGGGSYQMMVSGHKVGLLIGKGGEMIKKLQEQSGAKIVIIQDSPEAAMEKPLRITGPPESIESAKQLVQDVLAESDERDAQYAGRGRGRGAPRGRGGFPGRGGGAPRGRGGFGAGQWGGGPGGQSGGEYGAQATDYVQVPSNKCGLVIGKGGETIKHINQTTGAHCEVDKHAPADSHEKNFIIRGAPDAVERAKNMILEKLGMQPGGYGGSGYGSGPSWGAGGAAGGYQQPSAYGSGPGGVPQPGSQADYSAEWAEYYRKMGMTKEAEAIERARGGPQQPAAAPAVPQSQTNGATSAAASAQQDYSAQWASYYRSIGKIKEAEAIETQMRQKTAGVAQSSAPGYPAAATAAAPQGYPGYYG